MAEKKTHEDPELTPEELEEQNGEPLPDREVMSTLRVPSDPGIASIAPEPGYTLPIEPPATE